MIRTSVLNDLIAFYKENSQTLNLNMNYKW